MPTKTQHLVASDVGNTHAGNADVGNTDVGNTDVGNTDVGNTDVGNTIATCWIKRGLLVFLLTVTPPASAVGQQQPVDGSIPQLRTVAESSDFTSTSAYEDVVSFCRKLSKASPLVHLTAMGWSHEGRTLPLLVVADPPITNSDDINKEDKLVFFVMGNIHAGEVCGKEAAMMLARELAAGKHPEVLDSHVVLLAPIYNADGNERMAPDNRPGQVGPDRMGQRPNAQGLDLNRDHMKLESPEARSLAALLTEWDPAVVVDTHTTNGSHHRYTLTFDGPRHPATPPELVEYVRDTYLPDVSREMEQRSGYRSFFYGNFNEDLSRWTSYPQLPRFSTHYVGLRGRIGILSEAYSYATYRDRVLATKEFLLCCLRRSASEPDEVRQLLQRCRAESAADQGPPGSNSRVPIRSEFSSFDEPVRVLGYEYDTSAGKKTPTQRPKEYLLDFWGDSSSVLSVSKPFAYVIPAELTNIVRKLAAHGIQLNRLQKATPATTEVYSITDIERSERSFQGHQLVQLQVQSRTETGQLTSGAVVALTRQPLGALLVHLLEPQAEDGLCTWNYFDDALRLGADYPVLRVPRSEDLSLTPLEQ